MLFVKSQRTDMSVLAQFLQSVPSKKSKLLEMIVVASQTTVA